MLTQKSILKVQLVALVLGISLTMAGCAAKTEETPAAGSAPTETGQVSTTEPETENDTSAASDVPEEYNTAPLLSLSELHDLKKAEIMIQGKLDTCDSAESLRELEELICDAEIMKGAPACPFEVALYFAREDGSVGMIYPATDSCNILLTSDGYVKYGDSDNSEFWKLLGWEPERLR